MVPALELAQIPMTCYITSIPFAVVTWNGTNGELVTKETECMMYAKNRKSFGKKGPFYMEIFC